jgi:hypothetical protein
VTRIDNLYTRNQFYGGQVGLGGDYHMGRFFIRGAARRRFRVTWPEFSAWFTCG